MQAEPEADRNLRDVSLILSVCLLGFTLLASTLTPSGPARVIPVAQLAAPPRPLSEGVPSPVVMATAQAQAAPGSTVPVYVLFDLPKGTSDLNLRWDGPMVRDWTWRLVMGDAALTWSGSGGASWEASGRGWLELRFGVARQGTLRLLWSSPDRMVWPLASIRVATGTAGPSLRFAGAVSIGGPEVARAGGLLRLHVTWTGAADMRFRWESQGAQVTYLGSAVTSGKAKLFPGMTAESPNPWYAASSDHGSLELIYRVDAAEPGAYARIYAYPGGPGVCCGSNVQVIALNP